jgi:DNA polymerase-3 subunit delta
MTLLLPMREMSLSLASLEKAKHPQLFPTRPCFSANVLLTYQAHTINYKSMKILYPHCNELNNQALNHHSFWIFGDCLEYQDDAKHQVFSQFSSFKESVKFSIESLEDLEQAAALAKSKDLFCTQKTIVIQMYKNSFDQKHQALFESLFSSGSKNQKIIITSPALTSSQTKSKWMQSIVKQVVIIEIGRHQIKTQKIWLDNFCKQHQISLSPSAKSSLIKHTVNNPTACKQILSIAQLLYPKAVIDQEQLNHTLQASPNYSLFELSDAILDGNALRVHEIIQSHLSQATEIILMLWSIRKLITELLDFKNQIINQSPIDSVLNKIWSNKKNIYKKSLKRLSISRLKHALTHAQRIDAIIKGQEPGDFFSEFEYLCLMLVNQHLPTHQE